jgi:hypothetical protein
MNVKGISAFGAGATMVALDTAKLDLHAAIRTFAVNVGLSIFPFVSLQKYLFLDTLFDLQIPRIFRSSFGDISRKHTVKDQNTKRERKPLQNIIYHSISDKQHHGDKRNIDDQHTF